MSQVKIATAVLAGLAISDRLNELGIQDEFLFQAVGELAGSLGEIMAVTEKVDLAVGIVSAHVLSGNEDGVMMGLSAIKAVTEDLVSDQDKVMEAMMGSASDEEKMLLALLAEISKMSVR